MGWDERLTLIISLVSLFSFALYTVFSPNTYLALSSMLVFTVSAIALAELRIVKEMEELELRIRREIEELLKTCERGE